MARSNLSFPSSRLGCRYANTILLLFYDDTCDTVPKGIGYASSFLGVVGFYMSVAFYALSLIVNVICTSECLPFSTERPMLNARARSLHPVESRPDKPRFQRGLSPRPQAQTLEGPRGHRAVHRHLLCCCRLAGHYLREQHRSRLPHVFRRVPRIDRTFRSIPFPVARFGD